MIDRRKELEQSESKSESEELEVRKSISQPLLEKDEEPLSPEIESDTENEEEALEEVKRRYLMRFGRAAMVICHEIVVFCLLVAALDKDSIISLLYCFLGVYMTFKKGTFRVTRKVLLVVSVTLFAQYFIALSNWN